jgi:hypothetical protein
MIDNKKIRKVIEVKNCDSISCLDCPCCSEHIVNGMPCGAKYSMGRMHPKHGLRPRAIRIMKEWLEDKEKEEAPTP